MAVGAARTVQTPPRERIVGQPVHPVSKDQAVRAIVDRAIGHEASTYVCLTNVHSTVEAHSSPALRSAAEGAFLSVPDGMPLVWILRRRGYRRTEKVTGIELMPMVASAGLEGGLRHFLYGGGPGVAHLAGRRLRALVPGTKVVGAESAPFSSIEDWPLVELRGRLSSLKPHVIWVGLGAPKQELWMAAMANQLEVPVMVGVGAAFDYLAGAKPAAPAYLRHVGLEWLFRLAAEPGRLWRRYLVGNPMFLWLLARERLLGGSPGATGEQTPAAQGRRGMQ